jgi:sugar-phosphatase
MKCRALLFDLDGVLVDSLGCVERVWRRWALRHGLDANVLIRAGLGRRTSEVLRAIAPHLDVEAETQILDRMEEEDTKGMLAIPGARALVDGLGPDQWAIVTSGGRQLSTLKLTVTGLPTPRVFVTGEDVLHGKPDPQCYLRAAELLNVEPRDAIVIEDAPIGIAAARAAGMGVVGVSRDGTVLPDTDLTVPDLSRLRVEVQGGWLIVDSAT